MKAMLEMRNEDGAWRLVANCNTWGDACLLAEATTRFVQFARVYRARAAAPNSLEYVPAAEPLQVATVHDPRTSYGTTQAIREISAHKYVSPRARPLTPAETEVRRIAYALKIPTAEALETAARDLAPLLDAAEAPDTNLVLMPVPSSIGSIDANRQLANELAAEMHRRYPTRRVQIKITVGRQHPVESSCVRRRRGEPGLSIDQHAFVRVAGPLTATGTAYYFVDNVATTGTTLAACRLALGFGDAIVWADAGGSPNNKKGQ